MATKDNIVDFPKGPPGSGDLPPPPGGPYDGRMEERVGRLEGKMDKVEERLTSIEVALARIEAKLDSKVDYKWLTIYVLGIVAVIMRNEIAALFAASAP